MREGFFTAHRIAGDQVTIELIEIDETLAQFAAALATARKRGAQIAVGPLTRPLAEAVGGGAIVAPLPILTLNYPEKEAAIGPDSLVFGLSVELEAKLLVATAIREVPPVPAAGPRGTPRSLVLAGETPLARRVAGAFRDELRVMGERSERFDVRISYDAIQALADHLAVQNPQAVFLALEAREAAAIRSRLPDGLPLYATSLVNLGGAEAALLAPELEGVRFVDMPWLVDPLHPAVAIYPRSEQPLAGDLQRLYALGIDAYRLSADWLRGLRQFELDGVTGRLRVDRPRGPRVERIPDYVVFRAGRIERLTSLP